MIIFAFVKEIAIIGAGAAGCFCAVELSRRVKDCRICIYEAAPRPMAKLALTGGGRCNITNSFEDAGDLKFIYPRGHRLMKRLLKAFGPEDACRWFEDAGIRLTVQEDHCVFPESQDAMQVVRTLERLMRAGGVRVECRRKVVQVHPDLRLTFADGSTASPDAVVMASGGNTAGILSPCELRTEKPVPSLFTLKIKDSGLNALMGNVIEGIILGIAGTKFRACGTLLLTDWGISGPAALRLSSYAARYLADNSYSGTLTINWAGMPENAAAEELKALAARGGAKKISGMHPAGLSERLWKMLLSRARLREDCRWAELGSKGLSRLASVLCSDQYPIGGRCHFKEEFVCCGGVSLDEVDSNSLECRKVRGLYLAGEVLDIDAVTGGFNLQAAWSTAHAVARSLASDIRQERSGDNIQ